MKLSLKEILRLKDIIGIVLFPVFVFSAINDFESAFDIIGKYYLQSILILAIILILLIIFFFSLIRKSQIVQETIKVENDSMEILIPEKTEITFQKKWGMKKILRLTSIIFLFLSIIATTYIFTQSAVGLYYPIIASMPKNIVSDKVSEINKSILKNGYDDLELSIYCKPGQDYCAIVPGGVHFSEESAIKTLENAKKNIPQYVDKGAWIASFSLKDTFIRKLDNGIKRIFGD